MNLKNENEIIKKLILGNNIGEDILSRFYMKRLERVQFFSPYDEEFLNYVNNNQEYFKNKRIVEPGCGIGQNMIWLAENGFDSAGIDPTNRVKVMSLYNSNVNNKIKIYKEFFPCNLNEEYEVAFVGNIIHTRTGNYYVNITNELLKFNDLFISKGNFSEEAARPYKVKWKKYLIETIASDKNLELIDMKEIFHIKRNV